MMKVEEMVVSQSELAGSAEGNQSAGVQTDQNQGFDHWEQRAALLVIELEQKPEEKAQSELEDKNHTAGVQKEKKQEV